jgi:hypothetical protein
VSVLVIGLWWLEPRSVARWTAIAGLIVLLSGFGEFHRGLMAQRDVSPRDVRLPLASVGVTGAGLVIVFGVALSGVLAGVRGAGLRLLGSTALVAVMIQGLLGGFRVKLNELVGTDLAAVHGVFAQVVFCLLVVLAVVTAPAVTAAHTESSQEHSVARWSVILAVLLFVQVIWGAMVRHDPTPLTQRLHYLTAFLALAVAVSVLRGVFTVPSVSTRAGLIGWVLLGLLATQLYLGVEAWIAKFGAYKLPELVEITPENALIRTAHALVGSGLLACAVALAVKLHRTLRPENRTSDSIDSGWTDRTTPDLQTADSSMRFRGNSP